MHRSEDLSSYWKKENYLPRTLASATLSSVRTSYSLAWQHADSARGKQRHLKTYLTFACPHGTKEICSKDRIAGEANSAAHTCSTSLYRDLGGLAHIHHSECRMVVVLHIMVPTQKCLDLAKYKLKKIVQHWFFLSPTTKGDPWQNELNEFRKISSLGFPPEMTKSW